MARGKHIEGLKRDELQLKPVNVKLFICLDHDGFHGSSSHRASVIVARDELHARDLLDKALQKQKLMPFARKRYKLSEIPLDRWSAEVLADGSM